jgi:putative endonuclease
MDRASADKVRFYYVYMLSSKNNILYIGCTNNLKDRLERHKKGQITATKDRLPIKLVSYFAFSNKYTAFNFEKYLKSGSGRAFIKKHRLIGY